LADKAKSLILTTDQCRHEGLTTHTANYDRDNLGDRIKLLIRNGYMPEVLNGGLSFNPASIQDFLIARNKLLKENVLKIWNV